MALDRFQCLQVDVHHFSSMEGEEADDAIIDSDRGLWGYCGDSLDRSSVTATKD